MTLNIDLEDVPWAILEAVRVRIMSNRRRLLDREELLRQPPLQPKPQSRKFGADSKTWKRPQPAAVQSLGSGWLLVPSGPWQEPLQGFQCVVVGYATNPLLADEGAFEIGNGELLPGVVVDETANSPFQQYVDSEGFYEGWTNQSFFYPQGNHHSFTFETFVRIGQPGNIILGEPYSYTTPGYWQGSGYDDFYGPGPFNNSPFVRRDDFFNQSALNISTGEPFEVGTEYISGSSVLGWRHRVFTSVEYVPPATSTVNRISYSRSLVVLTFYKMVEGVATVHRNVGFDIERYESTDAPGVSPDSDLIIAFITDDTESPFSYEDSNQAAVLTYQRELIGQRVHLAISATNGVFDCYLNGSKVGSATVADFFGTDPEEKYAIGVLIVHEPSTITGTAEQEFTGSLFYTPQVDNVGPMRNSFSGVRFTNRALYRGPSFTPPTSITRLA